MGYLSACGGVAALSACACRACLCLAGLPGVRPSLVQLLPQSTAVTPAKAGVWPVKSQQLWLLSFFISCFILCPDPRLKLGLQRSFIYSSRYSLSI